jgi:hypothetical protein
MASQVPGCSCLLCGENGHNVSRCPSIRIPPDGFYSGGGGGGGHSHDDDDEKATAALLCWQYNSGDDGFLSKPPEQTPWSRASPNRPSNVVAREEQNLVAQ